MYRLSLCAFALTLFASASLLHARDLQFSGQVRPRLEFRDPAANGIDDSFTTMRVRGQVRADLDRQVSKVASLPYRIEAAYQTGERGGEDVAAFMVGARVGKSVGKGLVTLWFDYLSGDDDPTDGETKVFDTLFPTNHKFYGYADYFLNIPRDTSGGGLQDLALKLAWPLGALKLKVDLHSFSLAEKGSFDSAHLGEEIDLTLVHKYSGDVNLVAGLSRVIADDTWAAVGRRLSNDVTWPYFMVDTRF